MTTVFRAAAPVRLDFAGGWTDVPPYSAREGGLVVAAAIGLHAHAEVRPGGSGLRLISEDLGSTLELASRSRTISPTCSGGSAGTRKRRRRASATRPVRRACDSLDVPCAMRGCAARADMAVPMSATALYKRGIECCMRLTPLESPLTDHVTARRPEHGVLGKYGTWYTTESRQESVSYPLVPCSLAHSIRAWGERRFCGGSGVK